MRSKILALQFISLFFITAAIIQINSCSKDSDSPVDPGNDQTWKYGQVKTYIVNAAAGNIIKDTLSGQRQRELM